MKKKLLTLPIISIFLSSIVYAQEGNIGEAFYRVLGWIAFIDLSNVGGENAATFWAKFLLWIVLFTLLYYSTRTFLFKESGQNKYAAMISVAISILTILVIPADFIRQLVQTYASIFIVVLLGLPVLGIYLFTRKLKGAIGEEHPRIYHVVDAILFYLILISLKAMDTSIKAKWDIFSYTPWTGIAFAVCEILMIYHIIAIFFVGKSPLGSRDVGELEGTAKKFFPTFTDAVSKVLPFQSKERNLGRKLENISGDAEKTTKEISKDLGILRDGIDYSRTHPEYTKTVLENIDRTFPVFDDIENIHEDFDDTLNELQRWIAGQETFIGDALEGLEKLKNKDEEEYKSFKDFEKDLNELKEYGEGQYVQLKQMKDLLKEMDDNKKKIRDKVEETKTNLRLKKFDDAYRDIIEAIKIQENNEHNLESIDEFINGMRALIRKQRIDERKDFKKDLDKAIEDIEKKEREQRANFENISVG
ncbi:hypothetical protein GF361_03325 [Candidatus Woesearchaeota archaeon]|nr:hypothetical protein [Candidatus Woesearchaeota archaeon]